MGCTISSKRHNRGNSLAPTRSEDILIEEDTVAEDKKDLDAAAAANKRVLSGGGSGTEKASLQEVRLDPDTLGSGGTNGGCMSRTSSEPCKVILRVAGTINSTVLNISYYFGFPLL